MNIQKTKLSRPATEHRASAGAVALTAALLLFGAVPTHAGTEGNNFYAGFSATMESFDADYDKVTTNGTRTGERASASGATFRSDASEDETMHGLSVFAGYWWPVGAGDAWFGAELDFAYHGGTVQGVLEEVGDVPDGVNEYGESWKEDWSYEKERSYGLTFKLGMPLEAMGAGASVYALAGYRRAETRMHLSYAGCNVPDKLCSTNADENLDEGTFNRDATVTGWTVGAGFEKMLGEHTAFRGELRYTDYETNRWVGLDTPDLRVSASVDSDEVGVSLGLVRYF